MNDKNVDAQRAFEDLEEAVHSPTGDDLVCVHVIIVLLQPDVRPDDR